MVESVPVFDTFVEALPSGIVVVADGGVLIAKASDAIAMTSREAVAFVVGDTKITIDQNAGDPLFNGGKAGSNSTGAMSISSI